MIEFSQEVKFLAQHWGQPRLIENQIPVAPGLDEKTVRDFFSDRWAEVMMVIRRAADGLVWVMTKESFPQRLYSLPTGGIRPQETISAALWRELKEETGFEVQLRQFLAVIRHVPLLAPGDPQEVPSFVSYVFLLEEMNGDDPVVTGGEKILDFRTVATGELLEIARRWCKLSGSSGEFHDLAAWGMFRSIAHQVVGEILISGEK
jgi:8-oxo-dGTP diphosphatase